jgi:hypothetical protein
MPFGVSVALTLAVDSLYIYGLPYIWGGRSSAGRALDCGSSGRGFKSRRSPSLSQENPSKFKNDNSTGPLGYFVSHRAFLEGFVAIGSYDLATGSEN